MTTNKFKFNKTNCNKLNNSNKNKKKLAQIQKRHASVIGSQKTGLCELGVAVPSQQKRKPCNDETSNISDYPESDARQGNKQSERNQTKEICKRPYFPKWSAEHLPQKP